MGRKGWGLLAVEAAGEEPVASQRCPTQGAGEPTAGGPHRAGAGWGEEGAQLAVAAIHHHHHPHHHHHHRAGAGGSSGWTRRHSASGRSRSTRVLMTGSIPAPVQLTQPPTGGSGMSCKTPMAGGATRDENRACPAELGFPWCE